MHLSLCALVLLLPYLWIRKRLCLFLIVFSIIPQYHVRSELYRSTGVSNHFLVYGHEFDANIQYVDYYLDLIFLTLAAIILVYEKISHSNSEQGIYISKVNNRIFYYITLVICLLLAILYRLILSSQTSEEMFPTLAFSLLCVILAYSGTYAASSKRAAACIIIMATLISVLIGFKSLILVVFLSTFTAFGILKLKYIALGAPLVLALMISASALRGVDGDLSSKAVALATSHYDSWSFMVVSFSNTDASLAENVNAWLWSMAMLLPGLHQIVETETYGRYLNMTYVSEWLDFASVLLSPGIIGEFWSLGIMLPFLGLPMVIISYDLLYRRSIRCGGPYAVLLLSCSPFLLEAPMSNLGQLVKVLVVAYFLNQLFFRNKIIYTR